MKSVGESTQTLLATAEGRRLREWSSDAAIELAKNTTTERWDEAVDEYLKRKKKASEDRDDE